MNRVATAIRGREGERDEERERGREGEKKRDGECGVTNRYYD